MAGLPRHALELAGAGRAAHAPHWWVLLTSWFLAWLPHGIIGIGFAFAGGNEPSLRTYRDWASAWPGLVTMAAGAALLLAHALLGVIGFAATARAVWRGNQPAPAPLARRHFVP